MRLSLASIFFVALPATLFADYKNVVQAAQAAFDRLPSITLVESINGTCGANMLVNPQAAYCTSQNTIFLNKHSLSRPETPYLIAHLYGHASQVQHGVADVAFAAITSRPDEEQALRGMVTRQVECLAGVFMALADFERSSLKDWYNTEPFTGSHWGRNPLRIGPEVSIGLGERDKWFQIGQEIMHPEACAVEEMDAQLLIGAFNG